MYITKLGGSVSRKPEYNLGIRLANCQNLFRKIDFIFLSIRKNRFSDPENRLVFLKYSEKSIFIIQGRLHTLYLYHHVSKTGRP